MTHEFEKYLQLGEKTYFNRLGKVVKIVGLTIESVGPDAKLNDLCRIVIDRDKDLSVMAEVVGFRDKRLLLMPFDNVEGIGVGCIVENTGHPLSVLVGDDVLGHTLDGIGRPTDGGTLTGGIEYPVEAQPPDPMSRKIIDEVLPLGVKAVDGLITVGKGTTVLSMNYPYFREGLAVSFLGMVLFFCYVIYIYRRNRYGGSKKEEG